MDIFRNLIYDEILRMAMGPSTKVSERSLESAQGFDWAPKKEIPRLDVPSPSFTYLATESGS